MNRSLNAILGALLSVPPFFAPSAAEASGTTVTVGATSGHRGAVVSFSVSLQVSGNIVASQNDIGFDSSNTPIRIASGKPDCTASPAMSSLGKSVSFVFLPHNCSGTGCNAVRAIINDNSGTDIPSGTTLYTCNIQISSSAPLGIYTLTAAAVSAAAPNGAKALVSGINGQVTVN